MGDQPHPRSDTPSADPARLARPDLHSDSGASGIEPPRGSLGARLLRWVRRSSARDIASRAALPRIVHAAAGSPAGIEYHELVPAPGFAPAHVVCTDYCEERFEVQDVADVGEFLGRHRPSWSRVRWIHVEGLQDREVVRSLAEKYQLHPLAIEDALDAGQRPKADDYPATGDLPGRLFVVARTLRLIEGEIFAKQISLFLGRNTLLSFQDERSPAIVEVRRRIGTPRSRLRQNDVSFLLYSLLDALVDGYFPLLEECSERIETAEDDVLNRPHLQSLEAMHLIKRDLTLLRRNVWPMRELIGHLQRERHECLSEITQTYFRDVYDHCVQVIDLIETYREIAAALTETYISVVSNRTNDIMKVLTIVGTIFIPLSFLAGVYGMNFTNLPELHWAWGYPMFWAICVLIAGFMLWRFRRGGWI